MINLRNLIYTNILDLTFCFIVILLCEFRKSIRDFQNKHLFKKLR